MKEKEIVIPLPNGDKLVAEWFDGMPHTIAVGIRNSQGVYVQDLVVVEPTGAAFEETENDKFDIMVWADENSEDWTNKFTVKRYKEPI